MSKDKLEQFINENRTSLDTEIPSLHLWDAIDKKVNARPKKNLVAGRMAAGVMAFILMASFYWYNSTTTPQNINQAPPNTAIAESTPEFLEMTEYYSRKINESKGRLAALNHHDPDVYRDLKQMELTYDTLKMEWNKNPHKSDERLVNAMVKNYRDRYQLLQRVLYGIEQHSRKSHAQPAIFRQY